jgi:hypothetical protein
MRSRYNSVILAVAVAMAAPNSVHADTLQVAGSPTYDPTAQNGFKSGGVTGVNASGTAVGTAEKFVSGSKTGIFAIRWDASGTGATELANLGMTGGTGPDVYAKAINAAGTAVGYADKFVSGVDLGIRAVRWDAGGTALTELDNLGLSSAGATSTYAVAINAGGITVGTAYKYVGGVYVGGRAIRWDATGAATELGYIAASSTGYTYASATAINTGGTAVGNGKKYAGGVDIGYRAVRWDAGGTVATELGNLGTGSDGYTYASAIAINDSGTAVGQNDKYSGSTRLGTRAVRWDAGGTAVTELGNLGTDSGGNTEAIAYAVNASGTAVGYAYKYVGGVGGTYHAVRWNAGGTAATELANLGTPTNGIGVSNAYALNNAGTTVGYAYKYVNGNAVSTCAVVWLPNNSVIDLNDLGITPVPAGGTWTLTYARAMSDNGWVAGTGTFDPDGTGPLASYSRAWVAQVGLGGNWVNTTSANNTWGKGDNWSTGTPAIQLDGVFNANATYVVALDANQSCRKVEVTAGNVTLALGGRSLTVSQGLTIAKGARLAVNGILNGPVITSGTFAPGNSSGAATINGDYTHTGTLELDIASATLADKLTIHGNVDFSGTVKVILNGGFHPSAGTTYDLLDWTGSMTGGVLAFDFSEAPLNSGLVWNTANFRTTGTLAVQAVPEAGSLVLVGTGAVVLFRRRRGLRRQGERGWRGGGKE